MRKRVMTRGRRYVVRGSREAEAVMAGSADVAATWVVVEPDVAAGAVPAAVALRSVVALPEAPEAAVREASAEFPADLQALVAAVVDLRWAVA